MSAHSIEDWIGILKPLGYWDAADAILDDLPRLQRRTAS